MYDEYMYAPADDLDAALGLGHRDGHKPHTVLIRDGMGLACDSRYALAEPMISGINQASPKKPLSACSLCSHLCCRARVEPMEDRRWSAPYSRYPHQAGRGREGSVCHRRKYMRE